MKWEFRHTLTDEAFSNYENLSLNSLCFTKENIGKLEIKFEDFREIKFFNCTFDGTLFDNAFFSKVKFINCVFNNVIFTECNFNYVLFLNSKFTGVSFSALKIENLEIVDSMIQYSTMLNCNIGNSKIDGVKFLDNNERKNIYLNTEFFKCEFIQEQFLDTKFKKCDLRTCKFQEVSINLDDLVGSTLSILNMIEIIRDKGIILED